MFLIGVNQIMLKKSVLPKGLITLFIAIALSILMGKYPAVTAPSQDSSNSNTQKEKVSFNPPSVEDNGAPAGVDRGDFSSLMFCL